MLIWDVLSEKSLYKVYIAVTHTFIACSIATKGWIEEYTNTQDTK